LSGPRLSGATPCESAQIGSNRQRIGSNWPAALGDRAGGARALFSSHRPPPRAGGGEGQWRGVARSSPYPSWRRWRRSCGWGWRRYNGARHAEDRGQRQRNGVESGQGSRGGGEGTGSPAGGASAAAVAERGRRSAGRWVVGGGGTELARAVFRDLTKRITGMRDGGGSGRKESEKTKRGGRERWHAACEVGSGMEYYSILSV
jgi:hypothetical protein